MQINPEILKIAETIDQIMTIDVAARGSIPLLYKAARQKVGMPLALAAAKALAEQVKRGDYVFFLTGFLVRSQFTTAASESDGPPGTAILARTIQKMLGGVPVLVTEKSIASKMASILEAAGFFIVPIEKAADVAKPSPRPSQAAVILPFPLDLQNPMLYAGELIEKYCPAAVISIERGGPNSKGRMHNSQGFDVTSAHARTDLLAKFAFDKENGPLTIAVGDGGNEIGMGMIADDLAKWLPFGRNCRCPCGAGIIPETEADILVTATVSNWGANAVAAALAILGEDPDLAPNGTLEERVIQRCFQVGFIDGPTGVVEEVVDGMPNWVSISIANLFQQTVVNGLKFMKGSKLWATPGSNTST